MKKKWKINPTKYIRIFACVCAWGVLASVLLVLLCNAYVIDSADDYILDFLEAEALEDIDCIIVLGAGVYSDGSMSSVLYERVRAGYELYYAGVSDRLLLSGDHSRKNYNEVGVMKAYMTEKGIPESVVFTDHAGFDTYDTMYRARDIFKAKRVLIVTQDFHISRAVYIARSLGLEAYGYACDGNNTFAGFRNETRETAARAKYVLNSIFKPEPKYLGEEIPIWGDASASNG